ncbi:MAG: polyprenyl synthetase family protein [Planctomycetota bacterium]
MSVEERLRSRAKKLEPLLARVLRDSGGLPQRLLEAMGYCLLQAGKRLRPALVLEVAEMLGGPEDHALPAALAVELIHTYSLVHDDLPCMDDDDLRRGRPTVHKRYDLATAVLVGDALQALAFETLLRSPAPAAERAEAALLLAQSSGAAGMVGGQALDLEAEGRAPELDRVREIHRHKTAALIAASCEMGGIMASAGPRERASLRSFGQALGLAFQIVDDCLDETSSPEVLGKAARKDRDCGKLTWPACVGLGKSLATARELVSEALESLNHFKSMDLDTIFLHDLAAFVVERRL